MATDGPYDLYGYIPTEWICALFIALFGCLGFVHIGQALYFKNWWLFPTIVLAVAGEVVGWTGRLWSSQNPGLLTPFLMQITTTIISPTFLVSANFVVLGKLIKLIGSEYSRLGPNMYTIIFCCADVIALTIQSVGGASASEATEDGKSVAKGGHIMLVGIVFQLVAIMIFTILAAEFITRVILRRPLHSHSTNNSTMTIELGSNASAAFLRAGASQSATASDVNLKKTDVDTKQDSRISRHKIKLLVLAVGFSTLCLFIRSVYRTIELSNGFSGSIDHQEPLFNWLDGAMVVLAVATWNVLHPGLLLPNSAGW